MVLPEGCNEATWLAGVVLDELIHQGVRELVLSPGSRSAPLAFAALAAQRAGQLRVHVRLDERSAGFLALGLARVGDEPVAVMCTSGTAVANLAPAVVEASFSGVPLIVVSADRPIEARGVGAPQTIDQVNFFGADVRMSVDLGRGPISATTDTAGAEQDNRAAVAAAVAAAVGHCHSQQRPGPVQVNVGLRMPLVPPPGWSGLPPSGVRPRRVRRPPLSGCHATSLDRMLGGPVPPRGVVVAGDLPVARIAGVQQWLGCLAADLGWPVLAEPTANLHGLANTLDHGVLVVGAAGFRAAHRPDLVLTVGSFGLSRQTMDLVRSAGTHIAVDLGCAREVCDPLRSAAAVLPGLPLAPQAATREPGWVAAWQHADRAVGAAVAGALAGDSRFTGISVATSVAAATRPDGLLLAAASWPVRHLEAFAVLPAGAQVIGNRGANGIDGLIATAWGAAMAHQRDGGGPAVALLGDLAMLHDHNGLLAPAGEAEPDLVIVVADNNGGGIFHQLEQGQPQYAEDFERLFGTPHGIDLAAVARAAGRPVRIARSVPELHDALHSPWASGVRVVIAACQPRAVEAKHRADLVALAHSAVTAL